MKKPEPKVIIMRTGSSLKFTSWLTLIFVVAKIFGYIDWSWWWVFCPIWLPFAIGFGMLIGGLCIFGIILLGAIILDTIDKIRGKR
jgi:hypothetical protein